MPTTKLEFNLPATFMKKIADREKILIRTDAGLGISQEYSGREFGKYRSEQYKRYKANYMNKFTTKTGKQKKVKAQTIEGRYRITTGGKLKAYAGQSVKSNETAFVNETLTGAMFRDMQTLDVRDNEVTVSYAPKDAGKVLGARKYGRELVGLNQENIEIIAEMIITQLNKKIDAFCREDLTIVIG